MRYEKRTTSLRCGIVAAVLMILFGLAFFVMSFFIKGENNALPRMIITIIGIVLTSAGILNLIAVVLAPTNKFMLVMLAIFGIVGILFGGVMGILDFISFVKIRDSIKNGDAPYVSLAERRRHAREIKQERKRRMRQDRDYAKYIHFLQRRKVRAIFRSLFLTALSYVFSLPMFFVLLPYIIDTFMILVALVAYIVLCLVFLLINRVQIGFSVEETRVKTTDIYRYEEGSLFCFDVSGWVKVDSKTKTEYRTFYFLSLKALLFLLFGWLMFIPQTIGLLVTLFTPYDSENIVCGVRPHLIPQSLLKLPFKISSSLSFFLGFVPVEWGYLDYIYDLACSK